LLLLPLFVEQVLRALTVQKQGAGIGVMLGKDNPDYAGNLLKLIEDDSYTQNARAFADRYGDLDPEAQIRGMVDRCEEVMGEGRKAQGAGRKVHGA
jgi:hypothetical protein